MISFRQSSAAFSPAMAGGWQIEYIVRTKLLFPALAGLPKPYALISTSTPLGRSNLLSASTVREEEV